jgi:hypothetical protein
VRARPTCGLPVGDGAIRTRTGRATLSLVEPSFRSVEPSFRSVEPSFSLVELVETI